MIVQGQKRKLPQRRSGAAAAELALILPVMITIVLGGIDFGRFGSAYIAITNAARAGAGLGSNSKVTTQTLSIWQSQITAAAQNEFAGQSGVDADQLTVSTPQLITETSGQRRVQVSVQYNFQMIVPWPGLPNQVTLQRTVQMRMIF